MRSQARSAGAGRRAGVRGNAFVEFALTFVAFLMLVIGMFEFGWVMFVRATLHHAVREGVRLAITGPGDATQGFDDAIRAKIVDASFGIAKQSMVDDHLLIEFFDPSDGSPSPSATGSNIVKISLRCVAIWPITNFVKTRNPVTGVREPLRFNVSAADKLEPFPGGPLPRGATPASSDACSALGT